ncbi:hypothetical protein [Zobellia sp. B3R18]|nr:hypothetical protein [Zobellia sp. B3R18]MBU2973119.1 hypothetical protein [Zobellia sp. B3R18]
MDEFSWLWYYGMQHMGDLESHDTSTEMTEHGKRNSGAFCSYHACAT